MDEDVHTRCARSGVGCTLSTNPTRSTPEGTHKCFNIYQNGIRVYAMFCGYNENLRAMEYASSTLVRDILFGDPPITGALHPDTIRDLLDSKCKALGQSYSVSQDELLVHKMLLLESAANENTPLQALGISSDLRSGATFTVVILTEQNIFIANCGDCRTLPLDEHNSALECKDILHDEHSSDNVDERNRIRKLGIDPSTITSPTRALGDYFRQKGYKEHPELHSATGEPIIYLPDVYVYEMECTYLLIASPSVVNVCEQLGYTMAEQNKLIASTLQREMQVNPTTSLDSIARAVLDSLSRRHNERLSDLQGVHEDMSLIVINLVTSDFSTLQNTLDRTVIPAMENSPQEVPAFVDFEHFDNDANSTRIMRQLEQIGFTFDESVKL